MRTILITLALYFVFVILVFAVRFIIFIIEGLKTENRKRLAKLERDKLISYTPPVQEKTVIKEKSKADNSLPDKTEESETPLSHYVRSLDTNYDIDKMDGHQFEYYCAELLRKNGFENVQVTKSSGDQGVDILAEKDDIKYAIQCKCFSSDLGNTSVQEVYAGARIYKCQVGAVLTNRYFTQGAIEAARETGVLLWDRDRLLRLIDNARIQDQFLIQ